MFALLKIRYCQFKYELKCLGMAHILFLCALFMGFETMIYSAFLKYPLYTTMAVLSIVLAMHLGRKDARFVKMTLEKPQLALFFDYLSWVVLFIIPVLFTTHWYCFLIILIGIYGIGFIEIKILNQSLRLHFLTRFIPISLFELLSGARRNYLIIGLIILYILALGLSWVRGLPLFLLWLLTTIICSFFTEYEPLNMLRKDEQLDSQSLIKEKLKRYILPLMAAYLPILIVNSVFHPDIWWINPLFLMVQVLTLSLAILYKYATYQPKAYFNTNNPVLIIAGLCLVLPFLIPLILFFNLRYYPKAIKNLNHYLQ
jgi:uncharacterized membrane protein YwzB